MDTWDVVNNGVQGEVGKMKRYEETYKQQAVELAESFGNAAEAAKQLGISDRNIYAWKKKYGKDQNSKADIKLGQSELLELKQLRAENMKLKKVNHILKTATAFFSQDHLK